MTKWLCISLAFLFLFSCGDSPSDPEGGGTQPSDVSWSCDTIASVAANDVAIADLNQDGSNDVVYEQHGIQIAWLEQDSEGNWIEHSIDNSTDFAKRVITADINQDGYPDPISNGAWWDVQAGNARYTIADAIGGGRDIYATDLDGDGDIDLASASGHSGLHACLNEVSGSNWEILSIDNGFFIGVAAEDIDGDGAAEILAGGSSGVYLYDGTVWGSSEKIANVSGTEPPQFDGLSDIDSDGDMDLPWFSWDTGEISWLANDSWEKTTVASGWTNPIDVYALDVNEDGQCDFIASSRTTGKLSWFAAPNWQEENIATYASAYRFDVGDMDGDGVSDIVLALNSGIVCLYRSLQ